MTGKLDAARESARLVGVGWVSRVAVLGMWWTEGFLQFVLEEGETEDVGEVEDGGFGGRGVCGRRVGVVDLCWKWVSEIELSWLHQDNFEIVSMRDGFNSLPLMSLICPRGSPSLLTVGQELAAWTAPMPTRAMATT